MTSWAGPGALVLLAAANACSGKISSTEGLLGTGGSSGSATVGGSSGSAAEPGDASGGTGGSGAQGGSAHVVVGAAGESENGGQAGNGDVCATVSTSAKLEPVYLAFAFDVSGSMGNLDYPWWDPTLKWDPAVAATRDFLEDDASAGIFASLTAFPIAPDDEDARCEADNYTNPDVAMQALPSEAFGAELDAIRSEVWRRSTPTRAVLEGVMDFVARYREDHPGRYAVVLVTDGTPLGCDDSNTLPTIETMLRDTADDVPTYVIGVKDPPLVDDDGTMAPDAVSALNGLAEAGGPESAFIIDTGDPEQTRADFRKAITAIRGSAIACNLEVPKPPDGRDFQKDHVVVSTTNGTTTADLTYDEDCQAEGAWHYDSTAHPTEVVLCPSTCTDLQDAAHAELRVGFTCDQVITVR